MTPPHTQPIHVYRTRVGLRHTDAAGITFFPQFFVLMQDAFEDLAVSRGFDLNGVVTREGFFLPLAHAECDFRSPLLWGDEIAVHITVEKLGRTSFTLGYRFESPRDKHAAQGRTVQVVADTTTHKPIALPAALRAALEGV